MQTETITYIHQDTELEAYMAYPDNLTGKAPAVIISHAWAGRDQFVIDKANALAELGYIGFALDLYGKGVLGSTKEENTALMTPFLEDRQLLRDRMHAALAEVDILTHVDSDRIAAMGYCFGGLCVLDLARSGADIKGAVSVHGLLSAPENIPNNTIKAKVLALHGQDDPMVPPEQVAALADEMTAAKVDWQLHVFGNTKHAFTNPEANDPELGAIYNADADKRSWQLIQNFLAEIF